MAVLHGSDIVLLKGLLDREAFQETRMHGHQLLIELVDISRTWRHHIVEKESTLLVPLNEVIFLLGNVLALLVENAAEQFPCYRVSSRAQSVCATEKKHMPRL